MLPSRLEVQSQQRRTREISGKVIYALLAAHETAAGRDGRARVAVAWRRGEDVRDARRHRVDAVPRGPGQDRRRCSRGILHRSGAPREIDAAPRADREARVARSDARGHRDGGPRPHAAVPSAARGGSPHAAAQFQCATRQHRAHESRRLARPARRRDRRRTGGRSRGARCCSPRPDSRPR